MFDTYPVKKDLKQGDALSSLLFKITLGYATMKVQGNQNGLKF